MNGVRRTKYWTDDNAATRDDLHGSVTGVLDAGLIAMPMIGVSFAAVDLKSFRTSKLGA